MKLIMISYNYITSTSRMYYLNPTTSRLSLLLQEETRAKRSRKLSVNNNDILQVLVV